MLLNWFKQHQIIIQPADATLISSLIVVGVAVDVAIIIIFVAAAAAVAFVVVGIVFRNILFNSSIRNDAALLFLIQWISFIYLLINDWGMMRAKTASLCDVNEKKREKHEKSPPILSQSVYSTIYSWRLPVFVRFVFLFCIKFNDIDLWVSNKNVQMKAIIWFILSDL